MSEFTRLQPQPQNPFLEVRTFRHKLGLLLLLYYMPTTAASFGTGAVFRLLPLSFQVALLLKKKSKNSVESLEWPFYAALKHGKFFELFSSCGKLSPASLGAGGGAVSKAQCDLKFGPNGKLDFCSLNLVGV